MNFFSIRVIAATFLLTILTVDPSARAAVPAQGSAGGDPDKPGRSIADRFESRPCPDVRILSPEEEVSLQPLERRLVCGDPEVEEWRNVPPSQARYHLKPILETRGYYDAELVIEDSMLIARTGEKTYVTRLDQDGFPEPGIVARLKEPLGKPLTPTRLDEIEAWAKWELSVMGYPCAQVTSRADPDTGVVEVIAEHGGLREIRDVIGETGPGLMPALFSRYRAFTVGEPFDGRSLELTARRIQADGLALDVRYEPVCMKSGDVRLRQVTVLGEPRLITVGFGFDTEELFNLRAAWRNTRLGAAGSSIEFSTILSRRTQRLSAGAEWYFLDRPARLHARPSFTIENSLEAPYDALTTTAQILLASSTDTGGLRMDGAAGPSLSDSRTYGGVGPPNAQFFSVETQFRLMSHEFEFYEASPRDGFTLGLDTSFTDEDFLSDVTAYHFGLGGAWLNNFGEYYPPRLILGIRLGIRSTVTPDRGAARADLPVRYRYFLGGADDIRGFGRNSLPEDPAGALTAIFAGIELRNNSVLPLGFQPFVFLDTGILGRDPLSLDAPGFASPGLGLRWESPIGVFRGSIARGLVVGDGLFVPEDDPGWQLYLSYGQEF